MPEINPDTRAAGPARGGPARDGPARDGPARDGEVAGGGAADGPGTTPVRGLVIDYGGVLTTPIKEMMGAWAGTDGIDYEGFRAVLAEWFGAAYPDDGAGDEGRSNPVHAVERGEMSVPDFERAFAARLRTRAGGEVAPDGLLGRMFAAFDRVPAMHEVVRGARSAGVRTCLLSNSWGDSYSREGWDELFDAVVISGEVGMRKPEERIYRFAVEAIALAPGECVFVDDIGVNVRAAREYGMRAIHHQTPEATIEELESTLGVPLR